MATKKTTAITTKATEKKEPVKKTKAPVKKTTATKKEPVKKTITKRALPNISENQKKAAIDRLKSISVSMDAAKILDELKGKYRANFVMASSLAVTIIKSIANFGDYPIFFSSDSEIGKIINTKGIQVVKVPGITPDDSEADKYAKALIINRFNGNFGIICDGNHIDESTISIPVNKVAEEEEPKKTTKKKSTSSTSKKKATKKETKGNE